MPSDHASGFWAPKKHGLAAFASRELVVAPPHLHRHELVALLLEASDDLPDELSLDAVGLDGLHGMGFDGRRVRERGGSRVLWLLISNDIVKTQSSVGGCWVGSGQRTSAANVPSS